MSIQYSIIENTSPLVYTTLKMLIQDTIRGKEDFISWYSHNVSQCGNKCSCNTELLRTVYAVLLRYCRSTALTNANIREQLQTKPFYRQLKERKHDSSHIERSDLISARTVKIPKDNSIATIYQSSLQAEHITNLSLIVPIIQRIHEYISGRILLCYVVQHYITNIHITTHILHDASANSYCDNSQQIHPTLEGLLYNSPHLLLRNSHGKISFAPMLLRQYNVLPSFSLSHSRKYSIIAYNDHNHSKLQEHSLRDNNNNNTVTDIRNYINTLAVDKFTDIQHYHFETQYAIQPKSHIGVDIISQERSVDLLGTSRLFSVEELSRCASNSKKLLYFWNRKEAIIKLLGEGINSLLPTISCVNSSITLAKHGEHITNLSHIAIETRNYDNHYISFAYYR